MSANKPKQQETGRKQQEAGRRPGQEEDETDRPNPGQRGEQRHDKGNPDKNKKSGDFKDRQ